MNGFGILQKTIMLGRGKNILQDVKSFVQAHRDRLAQTLSWIQAAYILVVFFFALANDKFMLLLCPGALVSATLIFYLVRASLKGNRIATVLLFPVAILGVELVFQMSGSHVVLCIIGTVLYLLMLMHSYILSSPWQPTTYKKKFAFIVVIILNTFLQTAAACFEYSRHGEPWVGPPLQKSRVILFFVLFLLCTVWFLVRPDELSGKLCFLMNVMMNVAVTRNLLITVAVTTLSVLVFFIRISPVYQTIAATIASDNSPADD